MVICTSCGKPCKAVAVDFGAGWTEHFGERGFDSHTEFLSDCCETDVRESAGTTKFRADQEHLRALDNDPYYQSMQDAIDKMWWQSMNNERENS